MKKMIIAEWLKTIILFRYVLKSDDTSTTSFSFLFSFLFSFFLLGAGEGGYVQFCITTLIQECFNVIKVWRSSLTIKSLLVKERSLDTPATMCRHGNRSTTCNLCRKITFLLSIIRSFTVPRHVRRVHFCSILEGQNSHNLLTKK